MKLNDAHVLSSIRDQTESALRKHIDTSQPVAILDVPNHSNVGDHLIYAGERYYLGRIGVRIAYQSDIRRFIAEDLRRKMPAGTILIQGGGNVGDLWPVHQGFRERMLDQFPDYRIVQLPQSVYFRSEDNARQANSILSLHPDFTLLVREQESASRAARQLPDVRTEVVPDMAFGWNPPDDTGRRKRLGELLVLDREDQEKVLDLRRAIGSEFELYATFTDWLQPKRTQACYYPSQIAGELSLRSRWKQARNLLYPAQSWSWVFWSDLLIAGAVAQFSNYGFVITDRLHAHLLATLMGIPNVAMDNEYGKVSAMYQACSHRFSTSHFARDEAHLRELLDAVWNPAK